MDTSEAKPTAEQVKRWDYITLLNWIKTNQPAILDNTNLKKFEDEQVAGDDFLDNAGNAGYFKDVCKLPGGPSNKLAKLASKLAAAGRESAGIKRNRQQAEDVEMSDAADMMRPRRVKDAYEGGILYKPPRPLVKSSGRNWVFQPAPDLYERLASNVLEHYTQYKKGNIDKIYAPIYFYLGGAGTGKSRHGSEFASSVKEAIRLDHAKLHTDNDGSKHCDLCDLCDFYNELLQRLENAFVFHVSFENGTSLTPEEMSNPMNAVGIRMLHQLLGGDIGDIRSEYVATPRNVFQLVAEAKNVGLDNNFTGILVIDGIHNANKWDSERQDKTSVFYSFLSQIGDLSLMLQDSPEEGITEQSPFIMTCVTATYFGPTHDFLAATYRKRVYLPLHQLDVPTSKETALKIFNDDPGTHLLVQDVGGHARAIEAIAEVLAEYKKGQPNVTELADRVFFKLKDRYGEVVDVMGDHVLPIVQCILSRQRIRLRGSIPGSTLQWEHIIAPGLLWFKEAPGYQYSYGAEGYLVAPYMWLWLFARLLPTDDRRLYQFLTEWEFNDYQRLLHLKTGKVLEITSKTYQPGHVVGVGHVITTLGAGGKPAPLSRLDRIYTLLHHVKPLCPLPVQHKGQMGNSTW